MRTILVTTSSFHAQGFPGDMRVVYNPYGRKLTEDELIRLLEAHDPEGMIAGVEPITERALRAAPRLRAIARCGVGLDTVDVRAVEARGIALTVTAEAPAISVAELTLTLMLGLIKRVAPLDALVRGGGWKGSPGALLMGKRVGIVGCGRIGTRVAALVKAFGAEPVGHDPLLEKHADMPLLPLAQLLESSDIVTLHVPLTQENRHMIGREQLGRMKPGALILNIARGGLIDEAALLDALSAGGLGGAALDCFEQEPYQGPLIALDHVILSPHMGSSAIEGRAMMEADAVRNLVASLGG